MLLQRTVNSVLTVCLSLGDHPTREVQGGHKNGHNAEMNVAELEAAEAGEPNNDKVCIRTPGEDSKLRAFAPEAYPFPTLTEDKPS